MSLTKASYSMVSGAPVNILDFGADPTGVSDSAAAIQAALIAAANAGGKQVFCPAGKYRVDSTIYCGPSTNIVGEGTWDAVSGMSTISGTVFTSQVDGIYFFYALSQNDLPAIGWPSNTNANAAHSFRIENISIYGKLTTQRGIVVGNTTPITQIYLQNISVRDCLIGVDLVACYGISVDGVNVRSSTALANSKGFQIGGVSSPTSGSIQNCFVFTCVNGIYVQSGRYYPGFCLQNIDLDGCLKGIAIGDGTGRIEASNMFRNIGFENSVENDVYIRVNDGLIGFDGYIQASGAGTTGACIDASSVAATLELYLSNGRIAITPQGGVASIIAGGNVFVHTDNWTTSGTVIVAANQLLAKAEYVTGTWTPALTAAGGGAFTYSSQTGYYTKVGNLVFVTGTVELSGNTGVGDISVNLPLPSIQGHNIPMSNYGRITLTASYYTVGLITVNGLSKANLSEAGSGTTVTPNVIDASQLQATAFISFSGVYITS
jgi:hypothetical protein